MAFGPPSHSIDLVKFVSVGAYAAIIENSPERLELVFQSAEYLAYRLIPFVKGDVHIRVDMFDESVAVEVLLILIQVRIHLSSPLPVIAVISCEITIHRQERPRLRVLLGSIDELSFLLVKWK